MKDKHSAQEVDGFLAGGGEKFGPGHRRLVTQFWKGKINISLHIITKTCPCNIHFRTFSQKKMEKTSLENF